MSTVDRNVTENWPRFMTNIREVRERPTGHALAVLFGVDPKTQIDEDLARLKTTIETGTPPHDAVLSTGWRRRS